MEQTKKDQRGTADNSQMLKNPRIAGAVLIVIVLLFMGGYIFNKCYHSAVLSLFRI